MRTLSFSFVLIALVALSTSCALHTGLPFSSTGLDEANFRYVARDLSGTVTTTQIFGIGGLDKNAIVAEAKAAMLEGRELEDNQALANLTISYKRAFYVVVIITDVTVTADLVEFVEEED